MRRRPFTGKLLFFVLFFLGGSNLMNARSQTNAWLTSYSQVSLSVANQTQEPRAQARSISNILADARKVFDVDFIYESRILPEARLVIDVEKYKTVEDFLDELLRPYNLKYKKVLAKAYVIYSSNTELKKLVSGLVHGNTEMTTELLHTSGADARSIVVTGRLVDEKGAPLEGVSVTIKGSNKGTLTDKEGNFRLDVQNENAVLVFSLVGYQTKEELVGRQTDIQLTLATQSQGLNEVIVVGYGTQKKSVVTGAISSVKSSDLEDQPVNRLEDALQGRTSGVTIAANSGQPGSSEQVRVRGTTSINNSDPLYVVDGVPLDGGGLDYLNPADIESIEVLKDAASQAIYGARAAAGVILVTTKKGKAGTMRVAYDGYYGTQAPSRKLHLLNATQYATLRNESSLAAGPGHGIIFANPASLGQGTDWQSQIFDNSASEMSHQLSFSGGTDKSTFFSSLGYFDQNGIVADPISWYKRLTARFNGSHKINPWLSFGENIGYSYIKNQGLGNTNSEFGGPLSSAINLDPVTPVVITDPTILNDQNSIYNRKPVERDALGRPYAISNYVGQEETNPLAYIKTQQGYNWSHNIVANGYLAVMPIKGLELRTSIGTKLAFWGSNSFTDSFYLNGSTGNAIPTFNRDNENLFIWDWENTASYNRHFGLHNLTALIGTSAWENNQGTGISGSFQYMPVNTLGQATPNYSLPNADKVANGYDGIVHHVSSEFARVVYSYDDRYLLEGQIRRDGSTKFGPNNKYGYFPGGSVGWVVSRESFFPTDRNPITFLKVRGSYGVTGSDNIGDFLYESTVSGGRNYMMGNGYAIGYSPNAPPNPNLKWEQTKQTDVGFDAVVMNNITVTFDAYNKKTTGMLLAEQLPEYVGASGQPTGNVADMTNKGLELELGYTKKVGQVQLGFRANGSLLQNRINSMGVTPYTVVSTFQSSAYEISRNTPGHAIGSFYGFKTLGIFQTQADVNNYVNKSGQLIQPNAKPGDFKWADLDGDGQITSKDRTFIGDPTPHYTYGFTATAAWKGFDILVFGQGAGGNVIFQGLRRLDIQSANYSTKALGRWTGPGSTNSFPRLVDGDPNSNFTNPSGFYLEPGAYFRIKTLQLGYTIPQSLLRRWTLQKVRVYLTGYNLVTFTHYTGYDPEIGGGKNTSIDRGFYPQARTLQAGLSVGF
ncbi:SusC/RagA family TonB-linked outer membrane protein [Puia dinghuensis]|uniref:SusC/RagA family TonB-linked outer membrane protein n=1 Tax=Puia dinghuensis TaxID=1792502 RepID=A0A8J2XVG2_9BACT|nr:TonB-dependent receptor [Puia dinghuensis]GGB16358.1 SusC/RagA family TonB-linked outer membrane protein [Puia dinghuensis]